jgi:hypothetical protein
MASASQVQILSTTLFSFLRFFHWGLVFEQREINSFRNVSAHCIEVSCLAVNVHYFLVSEAYFKHPFSSLCPIDSIYLQG